MTRGTARILIVDDEPLCRRGLRDLLHARGIVADTAADGHEALRLLRRGEHRLVISDLAMPGLDGLGLMRAVKREAPSTRFVLLTGVATVSAAVTALKEGAEDVIEKPITRERLLDLLDRFEEPASALDASGIVTRTSAMRTLLERARRIAATDATVLIEGESGTGKEMIARAVHAWSSRATGPFVALNCAAMPDTLVEAELFGHERGAFTDARAARAGVIEQADGGTLFLDEIGEMPLPAQVKLLRVLQDRCVRRLGSADTREVQVRFVAATNRRLRDLVHERRFREDLYFRLDVMALSLPPLRDRPEDIAVLARHFAERWAQTYGRAPLALSAEALDRLLAHHWPGNVRELENTIHRAVIECEGPAIEAAHVVTDPLSRPAAARPTHPLSWSGAVRRQITDPLASPSAAARQITDPLASPSAAARQTTDPLASPSAAARHTTPPGSFEASGRQPARPWSEVQKELIFSALAQVGGNRRRAAEIIGIGERTLRNKLREYREAAQA